MKFFYTFSFAGLFSTTLLFSKVDISHEIKKLKQADESHRYVIMNRIKQQIATMNARQRSSAIALLRNKTSNGNSVPVSQAAGPGSTGKTTVSSPSNISAPQNSHTGPSHSSPAAHPQSTPQSAPQTGPQAQPQSTPQSGPQTQPQSPQTGPQSTPQSGPQMPHHLPRPKSGRH